MEMLGKFLCSTELWATVRTAIRTKDGTRRLVALFALFVGVAIVLLATSVLVHVAGPAAADVVGSVVDVVGQPATGKTPGPGG